MIALPRIEAIPRPVCRVGNGLCDDDAGLDVMEGFKNRLAVVEILIQVKDEIVKLQLFGFPSGLPLRCAFLRGHIPWLVRV
jgi:hypothetical protein